MKNIFLLLAVVLGTASLNAQKFPSLDKSPLDIAAYPSSHRISKKDIKVYYSRPQLRGRELSQILPEGKVWRAGANETTEIVFNRDVIFGGKKLKKGHYSLFIIPTAKEATVILNTDRDTWGAYRYQKEHDVLRVKVPVHENSKSVEAFSIAFEKQTDDKVNLHFGWGKRVMSIPIELK